MNEAQRNALSSVGYKEPSAAAEYAAPQKRMSDDEIADKLIADSDANLGEIDSNIKSQENERIQELYRQQDAEAKASQMRVSQADAKSAAWSVAEGIGSGTRAIGKNIYNGAIDFLNNFDIYAGTLGKTPGDMISQEHKWADPVGTEINNKADNIAKISKSVTEFVAPLVATAGVGGGALAMTGVSGAYNFLAIDPKEAKLADHLKGTFMENMPIVAEVIDNLSTKPDDTELDGRMKNLITGLGFDAALLGVIKAAGMSAWSASKVYAKIKTARSPETLQKVVKATEELATPPPASTIRNAGMDGLPAVQPPANPADDLAKVTSGKAPIKDGEIELKIEKITAPEGVEGVTDSMGVVAYRDGVKVGHAIPGIDSKASEVFVNEAERRKGVATAMYDFMDKNMVKLDGASTAQTDDGAAFAKEYFSKRPSNVPLEVGTPEEIAQLDLFEKAWATLGIDQPTVYVDEVEKVARVRLNSDEAVELFHKLAQTVEGSVLRVPLTDSELLSIGKELATDSSIVESLAKWTPEMGPLSDKQTIALKFLHQDAFRAFADTVATVVGNPNDDVLLLKMHREFGRLGRMMDTMTGNASEQGASLRSEQLIAALAQTGNKDALKIVGSKGRAKLLAHEIEQAGGREKLAGAAKNLNLIKRLSDITKTPDTAFTVRMGEVMEKSKIMRFDDAVTKVALNGMLSSPMTSIKAIGTNALMTAMTSVENYIQVGIGRGASAKTLAEANAHVAGVMQGFLEGIEPAWDVLKTGKITESTRMDLVDGLARTFDPDEIAQRSAGAWASKTGATVVNGLALNGLPTRVLMSVDTYWNRVSQRGFINAAANRHTAETMARLREAGYVVGDETATAFMEEFLKSPPPSVARAADEFAQTNTMAKDLTGFAETINNAIGGASTKVPFIRVVVPFFKTNANLIEETVERSPLAPFLSADFKAAMQSGGRAKDEAIAKVISGSTVMVGFTYLAANGLINGRNTENPEIEAALRDNKTVAPETSIKIGDEWVSLKGVEPVSTMLDISHFLSKASGHMSEEEYSHTIVALTSAVTSLATPEQMTDSLSGVMKVLTGQQGWKDYVATLPSRFTPAGALMTDARQFVDPKNRATTLGRIEGLTDFFETVKMRAQNQIPYYSKDLSASRNLWGEVLSIPDGIGLDEISPFATSTDEGMKLKNTLEKLETFYELNKENVEGVIEPLRVQKPSRYVNNPLSPGDRYRLTPKEYGAYQMLRAGLNPENGKPLTAQGSLKDMVTRTLKKYGAFDKKVQQFTTDEYMKMNAELSQYFFTTKDIADKLIQDHGDVAEKMNAAGVKSRGLLNTTTVGGLKNVTK